MVRLLAFYTELHWDENTEIPGVKIEFDAPIYDMQPGKHGHYGIREVSIC